MNDDQWSLSKFEGVARLFPLPNLVFFPHVVQALHIFEPRYRQMTAHALAGDQLIAMAVVRSDQAPTAKGKPALHPIACLGRIISHRRIADGRYVLLLRGLARVRIIEELDTPDLYRSAKVEILSDVSVFTFDEARIWRKRLIERLLPCVAGSDSERAQVKELFEGETPLPVLCDSLCHQLPLTHEQKLAQLTEQDVGVRVMSLLKMLDFILSPRAASLKSRWPIEFSEN